ncbi:g10020 [Coccomyxa viridis]|uniref:G10020 protein n=1 Tax=Coccomyxa viridis TaxID=1274662 RepID=A0ABP1G8L4_9CHLO
MWELIRNLPSEAVASLVDQTRKRLSHKSPIVKQKTLRLIKFICSKGSSEFKRSMSKQASEIRSLTYFRGEPDPFKGDVPNQKVRDMAKEALDAVFAAVDLNPVPTTAPLQSRIQGFGGSSNTSVSSASSQSGNAAASSSSSRMTGFGNPRFEGAAKKSSNASLNVTSPKAILGAISNAAGFSNPTRQQLERSLSQEKVDAYGGEDDRPSGYHPRTMGTGVSGGNASYSSPQLTAAAEGSEEERAVEGICALGGLRAQPSREDLRMFVENVASLNGAQVAELLQAKMEGASWQVVLRALHAVEAVLQQGSTAACGEIAVHFQTDPSPVRKAAGSPQASVRQRAAALLKLLGADSAEAPAGAPRGAQPASAADLMGGMDEPDNAAAAAAGSDLMGDLLAGNDASQAPVQHTGGLLEELAGPNSSSAGAFAHSNGVAGSAANRSEASSEQGAADMFGGLSLGGGSATANQNFHQASAAPEDLFGGLSTTQPAGSCAAGDGDMFGGLSLGATAGSASAAPLTGGSAKQPQTAAAPFDADLFGGAMNGHSSQSVPMGIPQQSNGMGGDIFGAHPAGSPGLMSMASPVKPQQMGHYGMQGGMQGVPWQVQQQHMQMQQQYGIMPGNHGQYGQQPHHMQQYGQTQMGLFGQQNGGMPGQGQQYQQMPGMMGNMGYGQPAPGLFSGGGALPPQTSTEQPRLGPKESTFDFVGDHIKGLRPAK